MISRYALSSLALCASTLLMAGCPDPPVNDGWEWKCNNGGSNYFWRPINSAGYKDYFEYIDPCLDVDPDAETEDPYELAQKGCQVYCEDELNWDNYGSPQCGASGFSSVEPVEDSAGAESWRRCPVEVRVTDVNAIQAALGVTAAQDAAELPCDFNDSCLDFLDYDAVYALLTPPTGAAASTADVQMVSDPTGAANIQVLGVTRAATGEAAYTAVTCLAGACPFYLAQYELAASSSMNVSLSVAGTTLTKTLSDVSLSLEKPSLGMWLPASGDIIFPPAALKVRVRATVSGSTNTYGENGRHEFVVHLGQYAFGTLSSGYMTLGSSGTDLLGSWAVNGAFVP